MQAIKFMIQIIFSMLNFFKTIFLKLWVHEVIVFNIFKSLLAQCISNRWSNKWNAFSAKVTFFQSYLQSHMWPTFKHISKGVKNLEWWSSFQYSKTFVVMHFSTLSVVGSQFISLSSLAPLASLSCVLNKNGYLYFKWLVFFLLFSD